MTAIQSMPPSLFANISANFLEASASENLALPRNVVLSFKAIGFGIVAAFFAEDCSGDTQTSVFVELVQQKFEVICIERNV